jgi:predicted negative regulator of RcsB-dependent stress response
MTAIWHIITGNLEWLVTGISLLFAALFGRERAKRKQAEEDAKASQTMRQKEKEARDASDDALVDRLTRNGL